ncbi:hypothetical protein CFP56_020525 [Quercus suber]|uniref:Uncharacterized protein n=1 Tax=Quercus suber TaxID=58331 RepID=A0AAW0KG07_QUESU
MSFLYKISNLSKAELLRIVSGNRDQRMSHVLLPPEPLVATFSTWFSIELAVGIEELLNALEAACCSDWKPFWTQPHNVLTASEID